MPNTYLNSTIILNEAMRVLHNKCNFIKNINRQYDNSFTSFGKAGKPGTQLQIKLPNAYTVRTGLVANPQSTNEKSVTLTVASVAGVDMEFNDVELRMNINDFSAQHVEPAMAVLASYLESQALTMVKDVANSVGTPGTTPASALVVLQAGAKLDESLAPDEGNRTLIVNPAANAAVVNALTGLLNPTREISKQYLKGVMGEALGFTWYRNPLIPSHTVGSDVTDVTVNGADQTGATITTAGGSFKQGDVITFAGCYDVHPETKDAYSTLKQFVVTEDCTTSTKISPEIITSGARQNCSASPTDAGAVTSYGTTASTAYPQNIAFEKDAFAFVTADLDLPKGMDMASRKSYDGISLRFLRGYDIENARYISRFDVLYGFKTLRPELACRIWG